MRMCEAPITHPLFSQLNCQGLSGCYFILHTVGVTPDESTKVERELIYITPLSGVKEVR